VLLQDIVNDDEIKLDWFFKMSLIHDIVQVSLLLRVMFVFFYPRDAMLARVIVIATCLSVRPSVRSSVCLSRAGIVSKQRKLAA